MNLEFSNSMASNLEVLLKNIGRKISEARKFKKIKIETVTKKLKIRSSYLLAIESGNMNALPDFVYLKGFIECYANYFELKIREDLNLLVEEYNKQNGEETVQSEKSESFFKNSNFLFLVLIIFLGLTIASFSYFGYFRSQSNNKMFNKSVSIDTNDVRSVQKKLSNISILDETFLSDTFSEFDSLRKIITDDVDTSKLKFFEIKFIDETWFQIESTKGRIIESGVFKNGDVISLVISKQNPNFFIHTGNAGGFILLLNNKALPKLGIKGSVKRNVSLLDHSKLILN